MFVFISVNTVFYRIMAWVFLYFLVFPGTYGPAINQACRVVVQTQLEHSEVKSTCILYKILITLEQGSQLDITEFESMIRGRLNTLMSKYCKLFRGGIENA